MVGPQLEFDFEALAREVRGRAGVTDDDLVLAPTIAERVLGVPVALAPTLATAACLARVEGRFQIVIREVGADANFDIAHELAHYALRELARYRGPNEERFANQLAAQILAPTSIVREIVRLHGKGWRPIRPLAKAVRISQTASHLRLGEVLQDERAVVTRTGNVIVRSGGRVDWSILPVHDLASGVVVRKGILRADLCGGIDEGRVALRAR